MGSSSLLVELEGEVPMAAPASVSFSPEWKASQRAEGADGRGWRGRVGLGDAGSGGDSGEPSVAIS